VAENTTAVVTLTATDDDLPAETVSFSISGGDDAALFTITGGDELEFVSAPDYENPADDNADNVYLVQVTASDGAGGTDSPGDQSAWHGRQVIADSRRAAGG
jgi:hypothetical protein